MFEQLAALLFLSREFAHRAHLRTMSQTQHVILEEFYEAIIGHFDELIECYQGRIGKAIQIDELQESENRPNPGARKTPEAH